MARIIPFYVPVSFQFQKQRSAGRSEVIRFADDEERDIEETGFWSAFEKILPDFGTPPRQPR